MDVFPLHDWHFLTLSFICHSVSSLFYVQDVPQPIVVLSIWESSLYSVKLLTWGFTSIFLLPVNAVSRTHGTNRSFLHWVCCLWLCYLAQEYHLVLSQDTWSSLRTFTWEIRPKAFLKWKCSISPRPFLQYISEARFLSTMAMLVHYHSILFIEVSANSFLYCSFS